MPGDPPPADRPAVPGYEVLEELGAGGMGVVWKARQLGLGRLVAVKMVHGRHAPGPRELNRFLTEAEAAAAVRHPHVVQVFEFGEAAGRPYLAMEYMPDGSLADRLARDGPLAPATAAALVEKVARAAPPPRATPAARLALGARAAPAAHDQQIVHRDLKPANVLFDGHGEPKVADFGLAKLAGRDLTATQAVMGTPAYMPPEQAAGGSKFVTPAADVWALGVVLYECLTGRRPFDGPDPLAVMRQIAADLPPRPRGLVPAVPRDLEAVCLKCLEKDPRDRYQSAADLAADLRRFLGGEPIQGRPVSEFEALARWSRRRPAVAAAAYVLSLMGGLLGVGVSLAPGEFVRFATVILHDDRPVVGSVALVSGMVLLPLAAMVMVGAWRDGCSVWNGLLRVAWVLPITTAVAVFFAFVGSVLDGVGLMELLFGLLERVHPYESRGRTLGLAALQIAFTLYPWYLYLRVWRPMAAVAVTRVRIGINVFVAFLASASVINLLVLLLIVIPRLL